MLTGEDQVPGDDAALENEDASDAGRRLTPAEWAQIKDLWELGTADASEICARFKIKPDTLAKRIKRAGIRRGSRAHEVAKANTAATVKAAEKTAEELTAERKQKIEKARSEHLNWTTILAQQAMALVAKAKQEDRPFSTEDKNLKALERAMKIVVAARDERFTLLDAHDEVDDRELPQLVIRDLTDAEIKARRDAQEADDAEILDETDEAAIAALGEEEVIEDGDDD
ncbi:peptidyl-tRNA hydrolase [Methylobacterium sp. PvP062]|uniref:Peptidyl-tRNA hydrolase n=1 Tax=Methylobacterium radiotolerans TaxID=31998 RepID=A0ABV2NUA3_9HYPH|nr:MULTISPECIES: hypothetical protein [unclassified Methylobacterium]MBP2498261.1 peptidyl-tRNA hydrolase [Methylobacterium sp. PvP105]MBP2505645.1 peptidyl-tRNA hydrolase [Methylobacterium sp. PvP109]